MRDLLISIIGGLILLFLVLETACKQQGEKIIVKKGVTLKLKDPDGVCNNRYLPILKGIGWEYRVNGSKPVKIKVLDLINEGEDYKIVVERSEGTDKFILETSCNPKEGLNFLQPFILLIPPFGKEKRVASRREEGVWLPQHTLLKRGYSWNYNLNLLYNVNKELWINSIANLTGKVEATKLKIDTPLGHYDEVLKVNFEYKIEHIPRKLPEKNNVAIPPYFLTPPPFTHSFYFVPQVGVVRLEGVFDKKRVIWDIVALIEAN